jgi:hypothetical protein
MYLKKSNKQKNIACMDQSTVCLFSKTSGLLFVRISKGGLPLAQNDSQNRGYLTVLTKITTMGID